MDSIKTRAISKSISIAIFLIALIGAIDAKAQEYKPLEEFGTDTISYVKYNFVERKDQYIGHHLEKLINDYEIFFIINEWKTPPFAPGADGKSWVYGATIIYRYWIDIKNNYNQPTAVLVLKFAEPHPEWKPLQALLPDLDDDREWALRISEFLVIEDIELEIRPQRKD